MEGKQGIWLKSQQGMLKSESALVVDRVLGPVLAQGSTATGSFTRRVKPERLSPPGKMLIEGDVNQ